MEEIPASRRKRIWRRFPAHVSQLKHFRTPQDLIQDSSHTPQDLTQDSCNRTREKVPVVITRSGRQSIRPTRVVPVTSSKPISHPTHSLPVRSFTLSAFCLFILYFPWKYFTVCVLFSLEMTTPFLYCTEQVFFFNVNFCFDPIRRSDQVKSVCLSLF